MGQHYKVAMSAQAHVTVHTHGDVIMLPHWKFKNLLPITLQRARSEPNELKAHFLFWEIGGFEPRISNPGRIKPMSRKCIGVASQPGDALY